MRILLAQRDATVGDLRGNAAGILALATAARAAGARLLVLPELALVGYPPQDLLDEPAFVDAALAARERLVVDLAATAPGVAVVFGALGRAVEHRGKLLRNVAVLADGGRELAVRAKTLLPTYDVFDEARWFAPAEDDTPVPFEGLSLGITICEDVWNDAAWFRRPGHRGDPVEALARAGADLLVNISASPYHRGKSGPRAAMMAATARRHGLPLLFVNQVGGNDELVFDGDSMALRQDGGVVARARRFEEQQLAVDVVKEGRGGSVSVTLPAGVQPPEEPADGAADVAAALVLGLRGYVEKVGFPGVLIGLSGGIDSAVVAALATRALGPARVTGVLMPSRFTADRSNADALELARRLGIATLTLPLEATHAAFLATLTPALGPALEGVAGENVQARIRGTLLMALSNARGALVLATGNKSELSTGYCTLYGDMVGGLAVLGDCTKQWVRAVAEALNAGTEVIPRAILERPPTAELRPGQVDEDSLPPYAVLDPLVEGLVERRASPDELRSEGFRAPVIDAVTRLLHSSEHKRRQAAPVLRVTPRAFGPGRRLPLARGR